ncbi:MAG: tetratricopeptide repeat protein [Chloroflexota bacterium]
MLSRQALTVFESIGNDYGVSRTQNHLGLLYLRQKRWDESKKALDDAIQTSKENGDSFGLMIEYMNYGLLNFGMGKGQETINWSEKAVNLARILEDVFSQGRIRNNVALGYRLEGKYDEAMTILKDVIALCQNHFDVIGTARAHLNIGEIHLLQGKQKLGMQHLDIAFETFSQINNADALVEILNFLTDYQIKYDQIDLAKETLSRLESVIENHHWGEERSKILQQQIRDYQLRLN